MVPAALVLKTRHFYSILSGIRRQRPARTADVFLNHVFPNLNKGQAYFLMGESLHEGGQTSRLRRQKWKTPLLPVLPER